MTEIQIGQKTISEREIDGVTEYAWDDIRVYRIGVESYPRHVTNNYLIVDRDVTLVDVSLDGKRARADLDRGFETVNRQFGCGVTLDDVTGIVISHGHADHWGMLSNPRLKGKRVYIHELDTRVLRDFAEVYASAKDRIKKFVNEGGWDLEMDNIFSLDRLQVRLSDYELVELRDGQKIINDYDVFHVPGHSPGHILLKVGPVIFLGDHILSETTPHQLPGTLIEGCGLRLYMGSLKKAAALGKHLGLPAHEDTIYDIPRRVDEMEAFHFQRLLDVLSLCGDKKNLFQITDQYYQLRSEYINGKTVAQLTRDDQILALEEIRAHIDYLIEDGRMVMAGTEDGVILYRAA